jgi:hypothetical protein
MDLLEYFNFTDYVKSTGRKRGGPVSHCWRSRRSRAAGARGESQITVAVESQGQPDALEPRLLQSSTTAVAMPARSSSFNHGFAVMISRCGRTHTLNDFLAHA